MIRTKPLVVQPLKLRPLSGNINNIKLNSTFSVHPIQLKTIPLRRDTDRDSIPDYRDCDPLDPNEQGVFHDFVRAVKTRGELDELKGTTIKRNHPYPMDWESDEEEPEHTEAILDKPEESGFIAGAKNTLGSAVSSIKEYGGQIASKMAETLQDNPELNEGEKVYLFIQVNGKWKKFPKIYSWEKYQEQKLRLIDELERNPEVTKYVFTTNKFYVSEINVQQRQFKKRDELLGRVGKSIRQQLDIKINNPEYAIGPKTPPRSKMDWYSFKHKNPRDGGLPPMYFDEYNPEPMYNIDAMEQRPPMGYQEESPFGRLVVPYRPTGATFLRRIPPKPLFKPPIVRKI